MKLMKATIRGVWRLTRATSVVVGLAVMLALVVGVGSLAVAAPASSVALLKNVENTVTNVTSMTGTLANPILRLDNNSAGTGATALDLQVENGKAPMTVNSNAGTATNLSADKVDGKHADQLLRVASFSGFSSLETGTEGTVATTKIEAPAPGFLVINAGSDIFDSYQYSYLICSIQVDDVTAEGSQRYIELNANREVNREEDCSTNTVVPVDAGTHTVDLEADLLIVADNLRFGHTALSAIYVPFDGTGAPPSPAAVSAAQKQPQVQASRK